MRSPRTVREFLNETIRFALGDSIVISRIHVDDNIWSVACEPDRIREMVMEMATKVAVAIPKGAAIEVEAVNKSIGLNEVPPLGAGKYVRLSIMERGAAIAGKYPFDQYYTPGAQQTEKTIGAGLFEVYSISKKCEGCAGAVYQADHGRAFNIYLPASANILETYVNKKTGPSAGKGRVLLMDDEEMIRDMAGQMLNFIGYEVELVSAGGEAIERYKDSRLKGNLFDVVILDLTIRGGMGGKDTIKALIEMDPAVKVILSSGEVVDSAVTHFDKYGFSALLPKPYSMHDLIDVLQEVLLNKKLSLP